MTGYHQQCGWNGESHSLLLRLYLRFFDPAVGLMLSDERLGSASLAQPLFVVVFPSSTFLVELVVGAFLDSSGPKAPLA